MKRSILTGWLCSLLALFGACDLIAQRELRPGESTVEDVRKLMGKPETIWEEADGRQVYEYVRGPEGTDTWMVEIGADGRYRGMTNALAADNLARVRPGMSRDDVRRLLGKPGSETPFPARDEVVWSWRVQGEMTTSVMFNVHMGPDGRVTQTSRTLDPQRFDGYS